MTTDGETKLAGGGPRQQLAQRQQAGKLGLCQPTEPLDEGALEIADMSGRTTNADASQP